MPYETHNVIPNVITTLLIFPVTLIPILMHLPLPLHLPNVSTLQTSPTLNDSCLRRMKDVISAAVLSQDIVLMRTSVISLMDPTTFLLCRPLLTQLDAADVAAPIITSPPLLLVRMRLIPAPLFILSLLSCQASPILSHTMPPTTPMWSWALTMPMNLTM